MWRTDVSRRTGETEYLTDAIDRLADDRDLRSRAERTLRDAARAEPLIADALRTPQTPAHHAEGPFVEDHLRAMLMVLYGVVDGKLRLGNVEELARLTGYEGEVEEIGETIRENAALFETFALAHDAAKWHAAFFDAPEGSEGRVLGFLERRSAHWRDVGLAERAADRARFLDLYGRFAADHPDLSPTQAQAAFYRAYGIDAHYAGHDRAIASPVYRALLERLAAARDLPPRDVDLLETLIAHHLDPIGDFAASNPHAMLRYHALAAKHGYDADDFVDLLQGCVFLDTVCASARLTDSGVAHESDLLVNFLRSEHDFAPWRRAEKERLREERAKKARQALFRSAGLDGVSLMNLLNMDPGPKFGVALRGIHDAIVNGTPLPKFSKDITKELEKRAADYFERAFDKGE